MSFSSFLDQQHLHAFLLTMLRLSLWLLLLAVIFLPLERLLALQPRQKIFQKATAVDIGYFFLNGFIPGILLSVPLGFAAWGARLAIPSGYYEVVSALPLWLRVLVGLVVGEIGFYWGHRWAHEIPLLWRFHSIHHSVKDLYFLVSSHAHPIDNVFIRLCGLIPAIILGVASPLDASGGIVSLLIVLIATMWGFFIHANLRLRLGPLEWVISTPAFHHWHHTLDEPLNRNYASMLPCMDMLFGTYYLPRHLPPKYGIEKKLPASLTGQLLFPFRR